MNKNKVLPELPTVSCEDCKYSGDVYNFLTTCSNNHANPYGYKKGTYNRKCKYFEKI